MPTIIVNDKMQTGYSYHLSAREGKDFAPDFQPELTPKQMLEMGVFEGHYLTDCQSEFPKDWFEKARINPEYPDESLNYFGIKSRLPLREWQNRGWIIAPDIRGWFQWYCRYYMGRRLPLIDSLQIKRWKSSSATKRKSSKIAIWETSIAAKSNDRHYCNGPIIRFFSNNFFS